MLKLPSLKMEAFLLQRTRVNSQVCLVLKLINLPRVHGSPDRAAASVCKDGEVTVEEGPERIPAWEQAGQRHQTVRVPGGAALMCGGWGTSISHSGHPPASVGGQILIPT